MTSSLLGRIFAISQSINSSEKVDNFAELLLEQFKSHTFFKGINRVCLVRFFFPQNELLVLSVKSNLPEEKELMKTGYRCFVSPNSSLFNLKPENVRIYSSSERIIKDFKNKNLPPHRSIQYLNTMGFKSGICLPLTGSTGKIIGLLFLNSFQENFFENLADENYGIFSGLQIVGSNVIQKKIQTPNFYSTELQEKIGFDKTEIFDQRKFKEAIEKILSGPSGKNIHFSVLHSLNLKFLYIPNKILYLAALTILFILKYQEVNTIYIERVMDNVVFKFPHSLNLNESSFFSEINLYSKIIKEEAISNGVNFESNSQFIAFSFPFDPPFTDSDSVLYSV